jgi:hypothetical protein
VKYLLFIRWHSQSVIVRRAMNGIMERQFNEDAPRCWQKIADSENKMDRLEMKSRFDEWYVQIDELNSIFSRVFTLAIYSSIIASAHVLNGSMPSWITFCVRDQIELG